MIKNYVIGRTVLALVAPVYGVIELLFSILLPLFLLTIIERQNEVEIEFSGNVLKIDFLIFVQVLLLVVICRYLLLLIFHVGINKFVKKNVLNLSDAFLTRFSSKETVNVEAERMLQAINFEVGNYISGIEVSRLHLLIDLVSVFTILAAFYISSPQAFAVFIAIVLVGIVLYKTLIIPWQNKIGHERSKFEGYRIQLLEDITKSISDIKFYKAGLLIVRRYLEAHKNVLQENYKISVFKALSRPSLETLILIGLISYFIFIPITASSLDLFIVLSVFVVRIIPILMRLVTLTANMRFFQASLDLLTELDHLLTSPHTKRTLFTTDASQQGAALSITEPEVDFLSFNELNVQIEFRNKFNVVRLCGASGSGKSTLLDIISGLRPLVSGRVCYCNFDERQVAYVSQYSSIIEGDLRDNILFGREIVVEESYYEELLNIMGLENLKYLNEISRKVSGGERARIGLARALVTQPKFLLIDESLSSIDQYRKSIIIQFLSSLETTIIYVSHENEDYFGVEQYIYV